MAAQPIYQQQASSSGHPRLVAVLNRVGALTLEYWALALTILLGIIVLAALSVPLLTYLGLNELAKPIFFTLHLICAQIPSHSFYILGHQLGMCARNMGIYTSMFVGGLAFVLSKKRLPGIPWWVWVLLILPMAYDGLTQMFGLRESTWELRLLTGILFGAGNMWFALPFIQRTVTQMMTQAPATPQMPFPLAPAQTPQPRPLALTIQAEPETPLPLFAAAFSLDQPGVARADEDASLTAETDPASSSENE